MKSLVQKKSREQLLNELLRLDRPAAQISTELGAYGWDSEKELVILTRAHLRSLINQFIDGALSTEMVNCWANAVESRDDIGFELGCEEALEKIIFELANPELTEEFTVSRAIELRNQL